MAQYRAILDAPRLDWTEPHRLLRRLGSGGQGVVYLAEREGADGFQLPVALKVFSPEPYADRRAYDEAMARMARVALRVAQIQQDNLLDVHNFVAPGGVRVMEMEWIDGYDLRRLLTPAMLRRARQRVDDRRWAYLNDVIVTAGAAQPRLKPGVAIAVLRDGLAALAALHRDGIVHGDVKPSNLMLEAHRRRQAGRHRVGLRARRRPAGADLHAGLRGPGGPGGRRGDAAVGPGQPRLRPHRAALRRPAFAGLRRLGELRGQAVDRGPAGGGVAR